MIRILFVDDEPNILQGIKRMLHSKHNEWELAFATGGQEALEILGRQPFDIVVTDIRMPRMDGIELLENVARKHPGVIRFILSGQAKKETMLRSIGPMHQYLTKPTGAEELKSAIERSIALRSIMTDDKLKEVISCIRSLPSLPQIYYELVEHLEQDEPSMTSIGAIISKDISMSAQILHLVNSSYFGFSHHVSSITQAVTMLGIDTIRVLVVSMHLFSRISPDILERIPLSSLWGHSLNCANITRNILKLTTADRTLVENGYMGALLHDIGIIVLAQSFTDRYADLVSTSHADGIPINTLEKEAFGVSHAEVGGYLLSIWGLPNPIIETVCFHHEPWNLSKNTFDHVGAVYVANILEYQVNANKLFYRRVSFNDSYLAACGVADQIDIWREHAKTLTGEHGHE